MHCGWQVLACRCSLGTLCSDPCQSMLNFRGMWIYGIISHQCNSFWRHFAVLCKAEISPKFDYLKQTCNICNTKMQMKQTKIWGLTEVTSLENALSCWNVPDGTLYKKAKMQVREPPWLLVGTVYRNYHRPALIVIFIFPDLLPKILRTSSQKRACPTWTYVCLAKHNSK